MSTQPAEQGQSGQDRSLGSVVYYAAADTRVIALHGPVDAATVCHFQDRIADALSDGTTHVVVDMFQVTRITPETLSAFIAALGSVNRNGGRLVVVSGQPHISRIFQVAGGDGVFDVVGTPRAAFASIRAGCPRAAL